MKKSSQSTSIKVACRLRPLNQLEISTGGACCLTYTDKAIKVKVTGEENSHDFTFDHIFGPETPQSQVYEKVAKPVLTGLLDGYNGTVFAYGQTSSGKTFTMEGPDIVDTEEKKGIIPRMMSHLFELIMNSSENIEFNVKVSFLELYNEKLHDLFDPRKANLQIKEDKTKGIFIQDVTEIYVTSPEQMRQVHKKGAENRTIAATRMNERSSRSHSIFILTLIQKDLTTETSKHSKLYFVDLAGSEKISKTHVTGQQLEEAKNINKSLSALGLVINALTDKKENAHVPYRDSKLTRLLQESLGGNSQTSLILACSMCSYNDKETLSTLRFGNRAKNIKNAPIVNVERSAKEYMALLEASEKKIKDQEGIIQHLQQQLESLSQGNGFNFPIIESAPELQLLSGVDVIHEILEDELPEELKGEGKEEIEVVEEKIEKEVVVEEKQEKEPEIVEKKPKSKHNRERSQASVSLMLLKQQIEVTNLAEELQEVQKINRDLQKEVEYKNHEIYNLNGKLMLYEHQMRELTAKNLEAVEEFRNKFDEVSRENQENAVVMSKFLRALNRLKSDLHFMYISKNLTVLDIAEKGSTFTPKQENPEQKQLNKEDLIIDSIQKTIETLEEIEKDLVESERKKPTPKDTEALLEYLLKDSEPNSSKKENSRHKASFPKTQSENISKNEEFSYNSDEGFKPSRLATDDSSEELEQSIESVDALSADIEPLEVSEDFTDDFLSIASDENKVNELQKLVTAQRQSIRNLSKFNSEIMQASQKVQQNQEKKIEGYVMKLEALEKSYAEKMKEYDEKIAGLKKLIEEKSKEEAELKGSHDKDAFEKSKIISDLKYQNDRMQKIILGNDLPKRVFELEHKLREVALDRQNLFESVFKMRRDADEKEDLLNEKMTQIQLLQSNINTLSNELEILKQFRPKANQNLIIKKRDPHSDLPSAEGPDTPQWLKDQILVPDKQVIRPIRGGGGNVKNFERDNFLVLEKPVGLGNRPLRKQESSHNVSLTHKEGEQETEGDTPQHADPKRLENVQKIQKATRTIGEMLKSDKGRKALFNESKFANLMIKPTLSEYDEKKAIETKITPRADQEGPSSIKNLFNNVKSFFS